MSARATLTERPGTPGDALTVRLLRDQQAELVRQYGPRVLLDAAADALMYYAETVQPYESGGTPSGRVALITAASTCRQSAQTLKLEALSFLENF